MESAIDRSSFVERREIISLYDLARNNTLSSLNIQDGILPHVEVMSDGGVFIQAHQVSFDKSTGMYHKAVYLVLDELYRPVPDHEESFVKILPSSNLLKVSKCISMNGEYNIEYLINVNNAVVMTSFELRTDVNGNPERISHSVVLGQEYHSIQAIINMIYSQTNTNGNGISNEFIKKYIQKHDK